MRIAIIAEGRSDHAVIQNILASLTGLDPADMLPLRPELALDETDKGGGKRVAGGWVHVKEDCEKQEKFEMFLALEEGYIVIHLDAAEADQYGVKKPHDKRNPNYSQEVRRLIIEQIDKWLNGEYRAERLHAIAIEETEAWLLPLYQKKDSTSSAKPKEKLKRLLKKEGQSQDESYENYLTISDSFTYKKGEALDSCRSYNESLELFCQEVISRFTDS